MLELELSLLISLESELESSEEDSLFELDCLVAVAIASGDKNLIFAALDLEFGHAVVSKIFVAVCCFFYG